MYENIYYILGGLAAIYIAFSVYNKRNSRRRRSRKFMDGSKLKDRNKDDAS